MVINQVSLPKQAQLASPLMQTDADAFSVSPIQPEPVLSEKIIGNGSERVIGVLKQKYSIYKAPFE